MCSGHRGQVVGQGLVPGLLDPRAGLISTLEAEQSWVDSEARLPGLEAQICCLLCVTLGIFPLACTSSSIK